MNKENLLAYNILQAMDIVILKRISSQKYELFGHIPSFYIDMFSDESGQPSCKPWEISPMLDFFLYDAEQFFNEGRTDSLTSGIWQEDGKTTKETALVATAATYGNQQVLIIQMLQKDYYAHVRIMRKARTQLLENQTLSTMLKYFKKKSCIDGLTQIFNKTTFMELLQEEIKRSIAFDYPLALLIMDIDDFKEVNDTHGHLVGDKVLQNFSKTLLQSLRRNDIIARFGGEEFIILIPQATEKRAFDIANKLREKIATTSFLKTRPLTVSTGCTLYLPEEKKEDFITRADCALYTAKKSGKDRVCIASTAVNDSTEFSCSSQA